MTTDEAIKALGTYKSRYTLCAADAEANEVIDMSIKALKADRWIPVKWHNITEEEREREGYPKEWLTYLDNQMPEDGQEILVTTKRGAVEKDVCIYDSYGFSLDSGWDWIDDIVAWMPLPKPYKEGSK